MPADAADTATMNDQKREQLFEYDAFISYDHDDRAVAAGIQKGLAASVDDWDSCPR